MGYDKNNFNKIGNENIKDDDLLLMASGLS